MSSCNCVSSVASLCFIFAAFAGYFLATVIKTVCRMLSDRCLSASLSVCNVGVLWPNGWVDQDETWHGGRLRPRPYLLDGDPAPLPKRGQLPIFGPCLLWPNGWMIKIPLSTEVDLGPGDIVLDRESAPPKKGETQAPPSFGQRIVARRLHGSRCHLVRS